MTTRARRSLLDWFHWSAGSLAFALWGGRARERFVRRLLARYPALAELPQDEFLEMGERVTRGIRVFHVMIFALAAGVAAAYGVTPVLIAIGWTGVRIPISVKVLLVILAFWGAWRIVRRVLIDRQLTCAVGHAYPRLFCRCGYCLLGLPPSTNCPECGAARTEESNTRD